MIKSEKSLDGVVLATIVGQLGFIALLVVGQAVGVGLPRDLFVMVECMFLGFFAGWLLR